MTQNFINVAKAPYASYLSSKIVEVQGAIADRLDGMDRATLTEKYPDLDPSVISDIVDNIDASSADAFKEQIKRVLLTGSPSEASRNIADFLTTKWE